MLQITVPPMEFYDESTDEIIVTKEQTLCLEHSLIALSKWESKWCKPFLKQTHRTTEEIVDYIRCMTVNPNVDKKVYSVLQYIPNLINSVYDYINAPMTATTVNSGHKGHSSEVVTSELIYYWMTSYNIWKECEKWHLNRLLMLIQVCGAKQETPKKMGRGEQLRSQRALNAARRAKTHSRG